MCLLRALHQSLPSRSGCCAPGVAGSLVLAAEAGQAAALQRQACRQHSTQQGKATTGARSNAAWHFAEAFVFWSFAIFHPTSWFCWEFPLFQPDIKPVSAHWNPGKVRIKYAQVWPPKNYIQNSRIYSVAYMEHGQEQGNIADAGELPSIWWKISKIRKVTSGLLRLANTLHVIIFESVISGLLTISCANNHYFYWKVKIQGMFDE